MMRRGGRRRRKFAVEESDRSQFSFPYQSTCDDLKVFGGASTPSPAVDKDMDGCLGRLGGKHVKSLGRIRTIGKAQWFPQAHPDAFTVRRLALDDLR